MNTMKTIGLAALAIDLAFGARADGTITVTASGQTNGRLSSLTLAFPAAAKASSIWVASGPTDAGNVLGNWQTLSFGADVAAGATSCTVPVNLKGGETAMRLILLANTDEFVELESVSSPGISGNYITTGFTPSGTSRVRCDFKFDTLKGSALFGARTAANQNAFCMLELLQSSNPAAYGFRYDYAGESKYSNPVAPVAGRRYLAEMNYQALCVTDTNGTAVATCSRTGGVGSFSPNRPIMIFGMNNNGSQSSPSAATVYSFKAWSGYDNPSTLVSDLVPCKKKDGTVGLINRKTGGFQTNTGTLTAGPVAAHSTLGTFVMSSAVIDACGLTRTMTVENLCRKGKRVCADLAFSTSLADSQLIAAYGPSDAGETLGDWPHTELLGVVPATTTRQTVTISAVIDNDMQFIRYFLIPRCASAAYDRKFDGIRATGTQYAVTGFTPTSTAGVIADFTFDTVDETQVPFSARTASGSNAYAVLYTTSQGFRLDYQSAIVNSGKKTTAEKKFQLDMSTYLNVDGTRVATVPDGNKQTFTAGAPLTLFALNTAGTVGACSRAVCHRFYAWRSAGDDSTRVLDLVPCEKNGEIGFYNKVDGKFYGNAGTGAFEAVGPETVNTNAQIVAVSAALPQPPPPGLTILIR